MSNDSLIAINITLADRSYRLKIKPEEEESVRKTVKEVNEKILEFKTAYAGKDLQDYIAMVLLMYATQNLQGLPSTSSFPIDLHQRFQQWETLLDKALS
ncbi:MAG: cell division protein ZapA [Chitinophagaceae bacterium]